MFLFGFAHIRNLPFDEHRLFRGEAPSSSHATMHSTDLDSNRDAARAGPFQRNHSEFSLRR